MVALRRIHCAVDLKWGEAETMAMKKTWQLTSITSEAQNGAAGKWARMDAGKHLLTLTTWPRQSVSITEEKWAFHDASSPTGAALAAIERARREPRGSPALNCSH